MDFDIQAFVQVVHKGRFAKAAADLGLAPSAVSKLLTRLEDRLGARLLNPATQGLRLRRFPGRGISQAPWRNELWQDAAAE